MRNSIKLAVFIIFCLSFLSGRAQLRFWKNYTQKLGGVLCMETFGDTTWTASAEGLTAWKKGVGRIVHYTPMNSDLDVNQLSGLQIDDQGTIWTSGTNDGLYRIKGGVITKYRFSEFTYAPEFVYLDPHDNLWFTGQNPITGESGLIQTDGNSFITHDTLVSNIPAHLNLWLNTDLSHNLWVATQGYLCRYDGSQWTIVDSSFSTVSGYRDFNIQTCDANGFVWGTDPNRTAFYRYGSGAWTTLPLTALPFPSYQWMIIGNDHLGNIYFRGLSAYSTPANISVLYQYDGNTFTLLDSTGSSGAPLTVRMDSTLTLWIARADGRMSSIDATGRIDYTESDLATIPNYHCQEVAFDKEDHTWVLAEDIARVFQDSVENISITFPDEGSPLTDVQTDTNDVVWVSRYLNSDENHHSCIAYKNGPTWTYVDSNAASPPGGFFSIAVDKFNNKWFGGRGVLAKYDNQHWMVFDSSNSPLFDLDQLYYLLPDQNGNLWYSGYNKIGRFDGTNWTWNYLHLLHFENLYLMGISQDRNGTLWMFTNSENQLDVFSYDGQSWQRFTPAELPPSFRVSDIVFDHQNRMWLSLRGYGLSRWDGSHWKNYTVENSPLPAYYVDKLAVDRFDNLWICSTYNGLTVFNENGIQFDRPALTRTQVHGKIYFDRNQNGVSDPGEPGLSNQLLRILPDNLCTNTDTAGNFQVPLLHGYHEIDPEVQPPWFISSDSSVYHLNIDTARFDQLDFGLACDSIQSGKLDLGFWPNRCRYICTGWLIFTNTGSEIDSGEVRLALDTNLSFVSALPMPDQQNGNLLTWRFSGLVPFEQRSIYVHASLGSSTPFGNVITSEGSLSYIIGGGSHFMDYDAFGTEALCSYDPNDKLVWPTGKDSSHFTLRDTELDYTIRFQNTGNDTAFFIQVIDTLDAALDPATLILTGSSHPMTFEQSPDGILRFRFDNVLLPDSGTNMEASNGFIRFRIKPYPALPNYTVVRNTAHIFFDFNDGVMTNTVFNTFLDSILISVPELNTDTPLSIYPNPATRSVNVLYPNPGNSSCTFQLVDRLGRTIQQGIDSSGSIVLETNHLIPGIYFVLIHNQDNSIRFSGRVAVQ